MKKIVSIIVTLPLVLAVIKVPKCCPKGQILNQWHHCIESQDLKIDEMLCANQANCQVEHVGFRCPIRARHEKLFSETSNNVGNQGCVEMAINSDGSLEGPLFITCDQVENANNGFVKKCCSKGHIWKPELNQCVEAQGQKNTHPMRLFRDPITGLSATKFHWKIDPVQKCPFGYQAKLFEPLVIYTNGTAIVQNQLLEYQCLAMDQLERVQVVICQKVGPSCATEEKNCVPKCCPKDEIFDTDNMRCVLTNQTDNLFVPSHLTRFEMDEFYVKHMHNQECPGQYFRLSPNTQVSYKEQKLVNENDWQVEKYSSGFCIDSFHSKKHGWHISGFVCQGALVERSNKTTEGTCRDEDLLHFNKKVRSAYTFCGLISLVSLLITMFVYLTLPSLKNLHGKIVLSNVTSILFTTLLLIIIYNVKKKENNEELVAEHTEFLVLVPLQVCVGLGYSLYYTGISMFCWMSVMCTDLCWTFARATIPRKGSDRMKFFCYSLFGWGMPFIMGLLTALFDTFPEWGTQLPQMGESSCFLSMSGARFFFYMPILILVCFNTLMYLVTVYSLCKTKKVAKKAALNRVRSGAQLSRANTMQNRVSKDKEAQQTTSTAATSSNDTREQLVLFTKLFLIMGLSWLSECIHVELHGDHKGMSSCNFNIEVFLRVIGGLNMMRGFFIFLVFIFKPKIWNLVRQRHPKLWRLMKAINCCSTCCEPQSPSVENIQLSVRFESKVALNNSVQQGENVPMITVEKPNAGSVNSESEVAVLRTNPITTEKKSSNKYLSVRSTYLADD